MYFNNILRYAAKGIILSWAVPGQGGLSHINDKPIEYFTKVLSINGSKRDAEKTMKLQKSARLSRIKSNINIYVRNKNALLGSGGRHHQWLI